MSPGSPLPLSSSILSELILLLRIATFLHFPCSSTKHVCLDALTELTGMESNILNEMFCLFTQKVDIASIPDTILMIGADPVSVG